MIYTEIADKKISKMSLGTVQLGMNYGIANEAGQPCEEESFDMLSAALSAGINSLDTARVYGNSEDVLGNYFKSTGSNVPFITTKVPQISEGSDAEIERTMIEYVETSLEKLGVKKVDNLMLHNASNLRFKGDLCARVMSDFVKRGYTDMVGASVYTADDVTEMLKYDVYTSTQIPMSIFDQRLICDGTVEKLRRRNCCVFVRSVFLQGVFFLDPDKITDPLLLEYAKPKIVKLRELAEKEGMSIAALAISFMRDVPGITSLVLGADTSEQVRANSEYFSAPSLSEETTAKIKEEFSDVNIPEIMKVLSRPKTDNSKSNSKKRIRS